LEKTNLLINEVFPTPPSPTTTILYSVIDIVENFVRWEREGDCLCEYISVEFVCCVVLCCVVLAIKKLYLSSLLSKSNDWFL
jgi:hypothetical protein